MGVMQVGESGTVNKARFQVEGKSKDILVQFNPEQYSLNESVIYSGTKKMLNQNPNLQYIGNDTRTIQLSLFFDTSSVMGADEKSSRSESDVSARTSQIAGLARVDGDRHRPPFVTFIWGSFEFKGVITKAATTFTMFDNSGKPVRAKMEVDIRECSASTDGRKSPLQSPDRTKSRMITEDVDIWTLAYREYGDSSKWRVIAKANHIMNPLSLEPGTRLKVPALISK